MDVTNLILNLKSTITSNPLDQQMASKAIKLLELGAVIVVESFSSLPLASSNTGKLYFVEYDGLYWSNGSYWVPIASTVVNSLWSWGSNGQGRLGDNTTATKLSPVSVVGGFSDWCQVSVGIGHSVGLRSNGTIWTWGCNSNVELGDTTTVSKSSPVALAGNVIDWRYVSAGAAHNLAIRSNGTLWSWGFNGCGRLGDGTLVAKCSPVAVVGGFTDWHQVSGGGNHSLGVRSNGTIWAWGYNNVGQLGDSTTVAKCSPVSVVGGFTDWCQASAGICHSLAVRSNDLLS